MASWCEETVSLSRNGAYQRRERPSHGKSYPDLAGCDHTHFFPAGTFCFNSSNQLSTRCEGII
jgi:hypothetical protein